ncbi:hypothetical protein DFH07DRAFT_846204 [Mycena maculata]|uniref:Uncharacterized protein n=1 Tax=Mycena maculata TaxID=230809 RepID=A0AAD7I1C3_9AGAR|nr:hypothetical protein DFH07DRAFT_846204 [Mycena maculata]
MVDQFSAAQPESVFILGNVTTNEVHGTQYNHHYGADSVAHVPDMPTELYRILEEDPLLCIVLGVLVVLKPDEPGTVPLVPLVSGVLGRNEEEVNKVLAKVRPYVKREHTGLALDENIRRWLKDPEQTGDLLDIPKYHGIVARWSLARPWSAYPGVMLYAAEKWHYHVMKARRSQDLYRALQDSLTPRRKYSQQCLPEVLAWLQKGMDHGREAVIKIFEDHLKLLSRLQSACPG